MRILGRLIDVIRDVAETAGWPLARPKVRNTRDADVADWEYVTIVLVFDAHFDVADRCLQELYPALDEALGELSAGERPRMNRALFLDVDILQNIGRP